MQQNANLAETTNNLAIKFTQASPIEFVNGQVLEVIASLKSTGDQLFEKTLKIDEKLDQVEKQFQQYMHQSSQKIYTEIERSRTLSNNSLNKIRQLWETKLNETAEICTRESQQIMADGQRSINEAIDTLKRDSEKALHSYLGRLEDQLTEAKEQHKILITDFKIQTSNDFENFVKKSLHELDTTKNSVSDIFDQKLETLLKILSDSTKEIDKNKTNTERFIEETKVSLQSMVGKFQDQHDDQIYQASVKFSELESNIERFIEETRVSLQLMVGEFQSQHDLKINQSAVKLGELESKAKSLLETTHSEFDNRWLNMVNTHNENLKSFRTSLKEAVVDKVSQHAKKRLDSINNEFQAEKDRISKNQEALKLEILSLSKKGQNDHAQIESTMKKLQKELTDGKKKSQLWILFITLFLSSIFIYSHYFSW
jgi:hypothetical protein